MCGGCIVSRREVESIVKAREMSVKEAFDGDGIDGHGRGLLHRVDCLNRGMCDEEKKREKEENGGWRGCFCI